MTNPKLKIAFAGARHGHAMGIYNAICANSSLELVAFCEEDVEHSLLPGRPDIRVTHTSFSQMLQECACDIVVIGDYFAKRGPMAIQALQAGRHVYVDKPLCTSLADWQRIAELSQAGGLSVGVGVELHANPCVNAAREYIRGGHLGKVVQIQFSAQHPLLPKDRPAWYFEQGKHGGTINDIAPHGTEAIHWLTGQPFGKAIFARCWQALDETPGEYFQDAAQFSYTLADGCGVLGDVSYHASDTLGYGHPCYWRFNIWGTKGMIELRPFSTGECLLYTHSGQEPEKLTPNTALPDNALGCFLAEIRHQPTTLSTADTLEAARQVLLIQAMAPAD